MKKATYIWAITLVIVGLMTTSAVSIHPVHLEETIDDTDNYLHIG